MDSKVAGERRHGVERRSTPRAGRRGADAAMERQWRDEQVVQYLRKQTPSPPAADVDARKP